MTVARTFGQAGGIILGCMLGLTPLLFKKSKTEDNSEDSIVVNIPLQTQDSEITTDIKVLTE